MLLYIISELRVYHGLLCGDLLHHKEAQFGEKVKQEQRTGERVREVTLIWSLTLYRLYHNDVCWGFSSSSQ